MGACQLFADAVTTALLAVAAQNWDGTARADYIDTTVTVTSLVCLAGEMRLREAGNTLSRIPPREGKPKRRLSRLAGGAVHRFVNTTHFSL